MLTLPHCWYFHTINEPDGYKVAVDGKRKWLKDDEWLDIFTAHIWKPLGQDPSNFLR